jgi:hypothetical protein
MVVFVLVGAYAGAYNFADEAGWISHTRDTFITAAPSWIIGESKACMSMPIDGQVSPKEDAWDVTEGVRCGDGPEHQIKVTFHGRTKRPDAKGRAVSWKCIRRSDSFECYALD